MKTYDKDEKHIIADNVECLRIIVDLGILDLLTPMEGANSAFYSYTTEDHYCQASYHNGHGNEDDGYLIVMVPKTEWTFEQAAQLFANAIFENTEALSYEYKKIPQKQNN